MSLKSDVAYGLQNIGNEGLYPLLELMSELGWDPINANEHQKLISDTQTIFTYLYNNKNNLGANGSIHDPHREIHDKLYRALRIALQDPPGIDLFDDLLDRSDDKTAMENFSSRLIALLNQHPDGLKKLLSLYTDMYHIMREHKSTLIPPVPPVDAATHQLQSIAYEDDFRNADQFQQFIADKTYRAILDKDLLSSTQQCEILSERLINRAKKAFADKTIGQLNKYLLAEDASLSSPGEYQALVAAIEKIIQHADDAKVVSDIFNELAKMPLIKRNAQLRAFLGEQLTIKSSSTEDPGSILQLHDPNRHILDFHPSLVKSFQEKCESELLTTIKSEISKRIYKNDGLQESYVPVSMKGIQTTDDQLKELFLGYDAQGKLRAPTGPINEFYHSPNGPQNLLLIMNAIVQNQHVKLGQPIQQVKLDDFFEFDSNNNIIELKENFYHYFVQNDINLHQLQIYIQMIKITGMDSYIADLFNPHTHATLEQRIEKLCCDYYNGGGGDKLYLKLSGLAGQSIDLENVTNRSSDKSKMLSIKDQLWELFPTEEAKVKLWVSLLLGDKPQNFYDLEKAVYQHQNIKTRQALEYQTARPEFSLQKEKNLFRNAVETRQHVPADDEYTDLQVGDTHGSNISLTQVGDIATAYATRKQESTPVYSWITLHEPQKAINCSHYMEGHAGRQAAQEFATGCLKAEHFLGAIKIKKLEPGEPGYDPNPKRAKFKIVDGYVSDAVLKQFSQSDPQDIYRIAKLYGLEGQAANYLSRAILFARAQKEGGEAKDLLEEMEKSGYLFYETSADPLQQERVRTPYQEQFDSLQDRRSTIQQLPTPATITIQGQVYSATSGQWRLFDPDSLRHYHQRLDEDKIRIANEHRGITPALKKRIRQEKMARKSEKKLSEEMHGYTDFTRLPLTPKTRQYASKYYTQTGLAEAHTTLPAFPPNPDFKYYLQYIENLLSLEGRLHGRKLRAVQENISKAVNALYDENPKSANKKLAKIFNEYYQYKRLPYLRGILFDPLISAIKQRDPHFMASPYLSAQTREAIQELKDRDTGLEPYYNATVTDDFLENLELTFEFIDTTDILTLMNQVHSPIHHAPWRRYQSTSDWHSDRQLNNWKTVAQKQYDISADGLNQIFEDLTVGETLPHTPKSKQLQDKMRSYPIIAGGGLSRDGMPIPGHLLTDRSVCTQYFRIEEDQLKALKSNEFITIIDSNECQHGVYGANYVVQYRYPDLRDAERLSKQYAIPPTLVTQVKSLLNEEIPPSLVNALWPDATVPLKISQLNAHQYAELTAGLREYGELIATYNRNLQDPHAYPQPGERQEILKLVSEYQKKHDALRKAMTSDPNFAQVLDRISETNQQVLHSLVVSVANDKSLSAIERYRKLISLHFFPDMNGRCLRMFYRQEAKKPLYMSNWDLDITLPTNNNDGTDAVTLNDFSRFESHKYVAMMGALKKVYLQAKQQGKMPDYYHSPEFWMAAFEINPKYYNNNELKLFMDKFKNFYMRESLQKYIEKKSYHIYMQKIMEFMFSWGKFKFSSHTDVKGNSALHLACLYHFPFHCLDNLLSLADQQHVDLLNLRNKYQQNPAHIAACYYNTKALTELYLHSPALLEQKDNYGKSPYNNLMDHMKNKIAAGPIKKEWLLNFIKFAATLDPSKYDVTEYRFESNATLAHLLAAHGQEEALRLLLREIPGFANKLNGNNQTPVDLLPSPKTFNVRGGRKHGPYVPQFSTKKIPTPTTTSRITRSTFHGKRTTR